MIFPTLGFGLFFLGVWVVSWSAALLVRPPAHKVVLLGASFVFYGSWSAPLGLALLACGITDWLAGRAIVAARSRPARRLGLALGVAANLGALGFFKYYGWFAEGLNGLLAGFGAEPGLPLVDVLLPLGLSFYTLQGISYLVDLSRGRLPSARPFLDVLLLVSFFPHLAAGPIVRAADFLPQLDHRPDPRAVPATSAVLLIVWGVFKKTVVASWLATALVDRAFFDPLACSALDMAAAIYGYAVQIYCDFSAYSDIAIGLAALLGYRFPPNFDQPYRAASLAEFWRRWHMSLSGWLRDYVYVPLGGDRRGATRTGANLFLTMLIGGLWHGAALKYLVWGGLHGAALAAERAWRGKGPLDAPSRLGRVLRIATTFHVICLGWVIFRADDLRHAGEILSRLTAWDRAPSLATPPLLALIAFGLAIHFAPPTTAAVLARACSRLPAWAFGLGVGFALLAISAAGGDGTAPFIYYRF